VMKRIGDARVGSVPDDAVEQKHGGQCRAAR
jgi:hypothetical protein